MHSRKLAKIPDIVAQFPKIFAMKKIGHGELKSGVKFHTESTGSPIDGRFCACALKSGQNS